MVVPYRVRVEKDKENVIQRLGSLKAFFKAVDDDYSPKYTTQVRVCGKLGSNSAGHDMVGVKRFISAVMTRNRILFSP